MNFQKTYCEPCARMTARPDVLEGAQAGKDIGDLERARQAQPVDDLRRAAADFACLEADAAGRGRKLPGYQVEDAWTCPPPLGPIERMAFAPAHIEVHAPQDLGQAEGLAAGRRCAA